MWDSTLYSQSDLIMGKMNANLNKEVSLKVSRLYYLVQFFLYFVLLNIALLCFTIKDANVGLVTFGEVYAIYVIMNHSLFHNKIPRSVLLNFEIVLAVNILCILVYIIFYEKSPYFGYHGH